MADPVWLVRRSAWGARPPKDIVRVEFDGLVVHYSDTARSARPGHDWCARIVKAIQDDHMDSDRLVKGGGLDIAYGMLACHHGYAFEGRGRGVRTGANGSAGLNAHLGAICYLGAEADGITDAGKLGLERAAEFLGLGAVPWSCHGDHVKTDCPGSAVRAYVEQRKGPMVTDISEAGRQLIKSFEGLRLELHDVLGKCHIGWGHLVHDGPTGSNPEAERPFVGGITRERADEILEGDLRRFVDPVLAAVTRRDGFNQNMADAWISLAFNVGLGQREPLVDGFLVSTTLKRWNNGDPKESAAEAILWWDKAGGKPVAGLTRRRQAEHKLFLTPIDEPNPVPVPPAPTPEPQPVPEPERRGGPVVALTLAASNMVVDVIGNGQDPGTPVIQWPLNGGMNQLWRELSAGDGLFTYVSLRSGLVLDVEREIGEGARLCVWWHHGRDNQLWRKVFGPGGTVRLAAGRRGDFRLDVPGGSIGEGTQLQVWPANDLPPQDLFRTRAQTPYGAMLDPVEEPAPPPPPPPPNAPQPPAHGAPAFPGVMREGDQGEGVRQLQLRLQARGWAIEVDGRFGPGTAETVRKFQREKKLDVDGIVGPATWEALWTAPLTGPEPAPPPPPPPNPSGGLHPDPVGQIAGWRFEDVAAFQMAFAHYDISVDGGAGPQTARAVQVVAERGGFMSQFFHMNELRSKGNGRIRSHRQLLRRADEVRRRKGPFVPVSPYRDPRHNSNIGAVPNSQHVYGTAFDIPRGLISQREAAEIGFSGIGTCGNGDVLHVDVRAEGPNNTTGAGVGRPTIWRYPC